MQGQPGAIKAQIQQKQSNSRISLINYKGEVVVFGRLTYPDLQDVNVQQYIILLTINIL